MARFTCSCLFVLGGAVASFADDDTHVAAARRSMRSPAVVATSPRPHAIPTIAWGGGVSVVVAAAVAGAIVAIFRPERLRIVRRRRNLVAKAADEGAGVPATAVGKTNALTFGDASLLAAYVVVDISVYLIAERSSKDFAQHTLLFMNAAASIVIGSAMSLAIAGRRGVRECFAVRRIVRLMPVAFCFCVSMIALLFSFRYFHGAFIKLLGQIKLPLTALLSSVLLSRRFSLVQWQVILLVCVACTSFTALTLKIGTAADSSSVIINGSRAVGLPFILAWAFFNVVGSLLAEKAYKKREAPFVVIITNLMCAELLTTSMLMCLPSFSSSRFFAGWDRSTFAVLAVLVLDTWLSALVVQRVSTVAKSVVKCASLVVLYAAALVSGTQRANVSHALGALMIVQATVLFASMAARPSSGAG